MRPVRQSCLCLLLLALLASPAMAQVRAAVTVAPQQYFLSRLGGELVKADVLVTPGKSPDAYEPTPGQMKALAEAQVYFAMGMPWEEVWLPRMQQTIPGLKIVRLDQGVDKLPMPAHAHHDEHKAEHKHGDKHAEKHGDKHAEKHGDKHADKHGDKHGHKRDQKDVHAENELDPHLWTSPRLAMGMAKTMADTLAQLDPAHAAVYQANLDAFLKDVQALDAELTALFADKTLTRRAFMVHHPAWGYFARDYNLVQVAIESEGKEPSPRELKELIKDGREAGVTVVFVQPQFSQKAAAVIAGELKAKVVPLDPVAQDWLQNLRLTAQAFRDALRQ